MSKKVAGLSDFKKAAPPGGSSSDEEDERKKGQSYYVGGSEKSGQEVVGPPRKTSSDEDSDFVQAVFNKAKQKGAQSVDPSQAAGSSAGTFGGGGFKLGQGLTGPADREPTPEGEEVSVSVNFWSDGFSVDDGPLRPFDNPESRAFVDSITQGRIPAELLKQHPGKMIDLQLVNKKGEKYKPPPLKPFSGSGQRLGGVVPGMNLNAQAAAQKPKPAKASSQPEAKSEEPLPSHLKVDENKPKTMIRVRFPDGSNLTVTLNLDRKLRDLREYICMKRPGLEFSPFMMMTTFPNKQLTEEENTLGEEKLQNAVIVVKLIV